MKKRCCGKREKIDMVIMFLYLLIGKKDGNG